MGIAVSKLSDISLTSEFFRLETDKGEVVIDIKQLLKEPVGSENAYFNATDICKHFGKRIDHFLKTDETKEYISKMEEFLNTSEKGELKKPLKMVITKKGRYNSGTFFHKELFLKFVSWLDVDFEIAMHQLIKKLIIYSNEIKAEREGTKILFKELSKTIEDIYIPNQTSESAKIHSYNNLSTLANIKVLGCSSKKYKKDNNIVVPKGKLFRDCLNKEQLEAIEKVEEDINGYIKYGKIYDYQKIKELILE